ncbi:S-adenosyl-L-methionine-dependent methyltransferase [Mytilinidion resinicola]|uniref:S-adenosyl-L-methionine-dependent methyltransferase n=1 Tax=Mytilinidion resinicola TaxID=574789 RepID=A0A6A6Z7A9_9PEZI|nr:S-adenosyl-L-methionine-dependent methyltransferase [Mytilinidion resinicola]KAF2816991.1 S-adenosyl-L-methionine-dependent methyltransferase [Mytilinidion resinicola]
MDIVADPADPGLAEFPEEPDTNVNDGYQTDGDDTMCPLTSSATRCVDENGRTYPSHGRHEYPVPNDQSEQESQRILHRIFFLVCKQRLHLALISPGHKTLDVGTGTGEWAIDFGEQYPAESIKGTDLSPIQPEWVPPNVIFLVDDAEAKWTPDLYTFIHTRSLIRGIRDWPSIIRQAHLKPGGWIECQEPDYFPRTDDGKLSSDNSLGKFWQEVSKGFAEMGVNLNSPAQLESLMREAGVVNVKEEVFDIPVGPWHSGLRQKEIGHLWEDVLLQGLEGIALRPLCRLGWRAEDVYIFLAQIRKEYSVNKTHTRFYVVYGQKP